MSKKARKISKICVICGINKTTSYDHIPPKCVFVEPIPKYRIKVPACDKCNADRSGVDEKFKAYLSIHVFNPIYDQVSPLAKTFSDSALKTVISNKKIFKEIMSNSEPVLPLKNNLLLPKHFLIDWDYHVFNTEIEYITRGLYFHHYEEILGNKILIIPIRPEKFPDKLLTNLLNVHHVGKDQFSYMYGRVQDHKYDSFWLFQFYNTFVAACRTKPITQ